MYKDICFVNSIISSCWQVLASSLLSYWLASGKKIPYAFLSPFAPYFAPGTIIPVQRDGIVMPCWWCFSNLIIKFSQFHHQVFTIVEVSEDILAKKHIATQDDEENTFHILHC